MLSEGDKVLGKLMGQSVGWSDGMKCWASWWDKLLGEVMGQGVRQTDGMQLGQMVVGRGDGTNCWVRWWDRVLDRVMGWQADGAKCWVRWWDSYGQTDRRFGEIMGQSVGWTNGTNQADGTKCWVRLWDQVLDDLTGQNVWWGGAWGCETWI